MLYSGPHGKSLVTDEFNQMCVDCHVEAVVQAFPNPGNLQKAMRKISFRNFDAVTVKVIRANKIEMIPGKGTLEVLLLADEELPKLERVV
jgi:hypothetical protein